MIKLVQKQMSFQALFDKTARKLTSAIQFEKINDIKIDSRILFDIVIDVHNYKKFLQFVTDSKLLTKDMNRQFRAELGVNFRFYSTSYVSNVRYSENDDHFKVVSTSDQNSIFKQLYSEWKIYKSHRDVCKYEYRVKFEFQNIIYQQISSLVMDQVGTHLANQFEVEAIKQYKQQLIDRKKQQECILQKVNYLDDSYIENQDHQEQQQQQTNDHQKNVNEYDSNVADRPVYFRQPIVQIDNTDANQLDSPNNSQMDNNDDSVYQPKIQTQNQLNYLDQGDYCDMYMMEEQKQLMKLIDKYYKDNKIDETQNRILHQIINEDLKHKELLIEAYHSYIYNRQFKKDYDQKLIEYMKDIIHYHNIYS